MWVPAGRLCGVVPLKSGRHYRFGHTQVAQRRITCPLRTFVFRATKSLCDNDWWLLYGDLTSEGPMQRVSHRVRGWLAQLVSERFTQRQVYLCLSCPPLGCSWSFAAIVCVFVCVCVCVSRGARLTLTRCIYIHIGYLLVLVPFTITKCVCVCARARVCVCVCACVCVCVCHGGLAGTGPFPPTPPPPPPSLEIGWKVPDHGRRRRLKQILLELVEGEKIGFHPMCLYSKYSVS